MVADSPEELLNMWYEKVRRGQKAQYAAANKARRMYFWLGIPTALFSALASAFIFSGIDTIEFGLPLVVSILSLLASIFASIQTFLGPSNINEHEKAAKSFGELKRRAQLAKACQPTNMEQWLEDFKRDWDRVSELSPLSPSPLFSKDSQ
ncbi:SLATT domain-containing protein [Vibrio cholerae]|nr:SLATT domain-containing protein [Vibrio cholerae]TQQ39536.1 SLATT domain-containing protein [Vibrio cholerae]